jgi:hypothetical protein
MKFPIAGKDFDNTNTEVSVFYSKTLICSPVYTFFLRQTADLIDNNFSLPVAAINDSEVFWAEINNQKVGLLCYNTKFKNSSVPFLSIRLTAVEKEFRGRGIKGILYRYFEKRAIELNCPAVGTVVSVNHELRLKSTKKDNLIPMTTIMYKRL